MVVRSCPLTNQRFAKATAANFDFEPVSLSNRSPVPSASQQTHLPDCLRDEQCTAALNVFHNRAVVSSQTLRRCVSLLHHLEHLFTVLLSIESTPLGQPVVATMSNPAPTLTHLDSDISQKSTTQEARPSSPDTDPTTTLLPQYHWIPTESPTKELGWKEPDWQPDHPIPYDKGRRIVPLIGLIIAAVGGIGFIVLGIIIDVVSQTVENAQDVEGVRTGAVNPWAERTIVIKLSKTDRLLLGVLFNALVTVCTECTGYVHSTTLKWALIKKGRLPFNANLRLFSTDGRWFSPNGRLINIANTFSLILSYAASSAIILDASWNNLPGTSVISFVPPFLLGAGLSIQAGLGFISFYGTDVVTWSTNPLDVASALYHHGILHHRPNRCMRSVPDTLNLSTNPMRPSSTQPSPHTSHRLVRVVVVSVWLVTLAVFAFGGILYGVGQNGSHLNIYWIGAAPAKGILWGSLIIGAIQSVITLGLHCCELVVLLSRDETTWRTASTSKKGLRPRSNPIVGVLGNWQSLILLLAKPILHWLYGQAIFLIVGLGVSLNGDIMFKLGAGMVVISTFVTFVAMRKPKGPQPAAYGHLQTLVDLVDEWNVTYVMYWGHKGEGLADVYHAGTSRLPLKGVLMDGLYAKDVHALEQSNRLL